MTYEDAIERKLEEKRLEEDAKKYEQEAREGLAKKDD